MERGRNGFGAGFWRISARVEHWRQVGSRPVCAGAGAGVAVCYFTPFLHFIQKRYGNKG